MILIQGWTSLINTRELHRTRYKKENMERISTTLNRKHFRSV